MASAAATAVLRPDHVGGVTAGAVDGAGGCADGGVTGSAGTTITLVGITVVRSVVVAIGLSLLCGRGTPRPSRCLLCRGCGPRIAHLSSRHRALTGFIQVHGRRFSDRAATLPLMTQQTAHTSGSDLRRLDGSPVRVLVVDDEENLTELLRMALRYEGWDVRSAGTGMAAVRAAREFQPDAVALDMMLPDFDGMEVLRRMRADNPNVPVLFLTARDAVEDRVAGLTAGGDDYVTKPFSLEEVVARLRALMRRTAIMNEGSDSVLVVGDLTLDEDSHEVTRAGHQIALTATEFELLRYLMRNPKRVLSKAQILDRVWNYDFGGQANVVELYISYLRKKIDARP